MADLPDDVQFIGRHDHIEVVWWTTPSGQVQPVIWPMGLTSTEQTGRA